MFKAEHLTDALLKRFAVQVPAGAYLFKQGEKGNTLFILVEGIVELYHKTMTTERLVGTLGEGEIIGEKTIISGNPYKRALSALAKTEATVLQFDHASLKAIQSKMPDFTTKLLSVVIQRLERANEMLAILRLANPVERVAMYMLHAAEHFSKKTQAGSELVFKLEEVELQIMVDHETLKTFVDELLAEKIIQLKGTTLVLTSDQALLQLVPVIKERLAA